MSSAEQSDYNRKNPFLLIDGGKVVARRSTAKACMNLATRWRCRGPVIIRHDRTNRTWHRRGGTWFSDKQLGAPLSRRRERRSRKAR